MIPLGAVGWFAALIQPEHAEAWYRATSIPGVVAATICAIAARLPNRLSGR